MTDLAALAIALSALSEAHHELGALYADAAAHLDSHGTVSADALMLARAIQGEGAALFGARRDEVGAWIVHTALNYWETGWWDTPEYRAIIAKRIGVDHLDSEDVRFWMVVATQYHGTAIVAGDPEPWAIRLAYNELEVRREGGPDKARGARFMLSFDDLRRHGWEEQARAVNVQILVSPLRPTTQFWFLRAYPGEVPE